MVKEYFPDGTEIDAWFYNTKVATLDELGQQYLITDYGVKSDGNIYTKEIQSLIDSVAENGGGVIVVPAGIYYSGALFFKQGVHLYIAKDGILKGSDDICDYPVCQTRIEGESCLYFPALINADGVDGFTILGEGTIDGNGERAWRAFWKRIEWNPNLSNKDEQRPRLVFISNSKNVTVSGLCLQNSHFWTNHIYKCENVRYLGCKILAPREPVRAPSSDALDLDVCKRVLVKDCYFSVNDDAVVLKGGKGPWADTLPENGSNEEILVEDCTFGWCHCTFTCGSESIHNRNVIFRNSKVDNMWRLFLFKMRPDTPQHFEYITMENIEGTAEEFLTIRTFWGKKVRDDMPLSRVHHITIRDCNFKVKKYCDVVKNEEQYILSDFLFENLMIRAEEDGYQKGAIVNEKIKNVTIIQENF